MIIARGKYGVPLEDIATYVERAVTELNLDSSLITDMDSAMYAWRLSYNQKNAEVARRFLGNGLESLSQLARAMASADGELVTRIERDPEYHLPPLSRIERDPEYHLPPLSRIERDPEYHLPPLKSSDSK